MIESPPISMSMVLLAFAVRHWQHQQMAIGGFGVVTFLVCLTLPESPRWLAQVGRVEEAEKLMEKIAQSNKRSLNDEDRNLISTFLRQVSRQIFFHCADVQCLNLVLLSQNEVVWSVDAISGSRIKVLHMDFIIIHFISTHWMMTTNT